MKITQLQLVSHLKKNRLPIYILNGDEFVLKEEAKLALRNAAKAHQFNERYHFVADKNFDWQLFYTTLYTQSFLDDKRLIELDVRQSLPNKMGGEILQSYAEKINPQVMLVIDLEKIDSKTAKASWYQALEKFGAVITIWPLTREQFPKWIIDQAKQYHLQMTYAVAQLLTDYVEGNLLAASQAIEKIYLFNPVDKTISSELIHTILTDQTHFSIFDFIECLIAGDKKRTLTLLAHLQAEGTEPILLLWAITRELRILAAIAKDQSQGNELQTLWQKYRIFARRQTAVKQFLARFTVEDCWQYLQTALRLDQVIKGAIQENSWRELQFFCLRFL